MERLYKQHQERRNGKAAKSPRQEAEHAIGPSQGCPGAECTKWRKKHTNCEADHSQTDYARDGEPGA